MSLLAKLAGLFLMSVCVAIPRTDALDILVVRHAQTLANISDDYSLFAHRHFTELGQNQIRTLTETLGTRTFTAILSSPSYRVRRTLLPYLENTKQTAELWPSLDECCVGTESEGARYPAGALILIESEHRPYFTLRDDVPATAPEGQSYTDDLRRIQQTADDIKARWGGTDATLLIATHEYTGSRLIEALLGRDMTGSLKLENASITRLHEVDGHLTLAPK